MNFKLHSEYEPTGDQPQAIKELRERILFCGAIKHLTKNTIVLQ